MTRVLLVCPEPLGPQPAGVGIRILEMARVLRDDGHAITILSPNAGTIEGARGGYIDPATLLAESRDAEMAIVQGHVANAFFMQGNSIPTVVDLYDPYVIENLHYYSERGAQVFTFDHFTLIQSLQRGDFFLCASEAQRLFYLGLLLATGRLNPILFERDPRLETLIAIAPFGVQVPRPLTNTKGHSILFGGIYDWYDPIMAIEAVALVRERLPDVTLTFTMHPNPATTPQGKLGEAMRHVGAKRYDFIRFDPWVPYDKRGEFFSRFAMALLTFPRSIETDLSMRTRVYDYLWSGLPIVTSAAPGTDEILTRYGAGSVIEGSDSRAFADEIIGVLSDESRLTDMRRGATRFATEHQWPETLQPLRAFCNAPRFDSTKDAFAATVRMESEEPSLFRRIRRRLRP